MWYSVSNAQNSEVRNFKPFPSRYETGRSGGNGIIKNEYKQLKININRSARGIKIKNMKSLIMQNFVIKFLVVAMCVVLISSCTAEEFGMSLFESMLLFIGLFFLGIILNIFIKTTGNGFIVFLYIITVVAVAIFSVPVFASFSSQEFLDHTTHYTSGSSMDGYQFWGFGTLFIYPCISELIACGITEKQPFK